MGTRIDGRTGLEEIDREECLALVASVPLGRIGVVVGGRPLIFPVNFTLDGDAIVLRTGEGTKLFGARNGPVVFECDGFDTAYHTGWSVLVFADAEEVSGENEIARLERLPLRTWGPGPRSRWLRLRIQSVTGRRIAPHTGTSCKGELS